MKSFAIVFGVVFVLLILLVIGISRWVWIPDVISGKASIVAIKENDWKDRFAVDQKWAGDGYLTKLHVRFVDGREEEFVINPDGPKIWKCDLIWDNDKNTLSIMNGKRIVVVFDGDGLRYPPM